MLISASFLSFCFPKHGCFSFDESAMKTPRRSKKFSINREASRAPVIPYASNWSNDRLNTRSYEMIIIAAISIVYFNLQTSDSPHDARNNSSIIVSIPFVRCVRPWPMKFYCFLLNGVYDTCCVPYLGSYSSGQEDGYHTPLPVNRRI